MANPSSIETFLKQIETTLASIRLELANPNISPPVVAPPVVAPPVVITPPPTPPPVVSPPPATSAMKIPLLGGQAQGQQWLNTQVGWMSAPTRQRETVAPQIPWRLTSARCDSAKPPAVWVGNRYDSMSLLYFKKPAIVLKNGKPTQKHFSHNAGIDPQSGIDRMNKFPLRGGQQGSACISPYVTYRGHASGGTPDAPKGPLFFWAGGMQIGYLNTDGTSQVVAGRIPIDTLALYDEDHPENYWKWVGNFPDDKPVGIYDLTGFRAERKYFYCSDFTKNCAWEVERPDTKDAATWIWRKISGFVKPMYIQDTFDASTNTGRVFVTDEKGLWEIDRTMLTATLTLPLPGAMFVRVTGKETLVVADKFSKFVEYDPAAKTTRLIKNGTSGALPIIIGDVSPAAPHDYFLPQDTIVWSPGAGATPDGSNNGFFCMDLNGVVRTTPIFPQAGGNMPHGPSINVLDMYGHYPWALAFHPELSLIASTGFGSGGVNLIRPIHADDKNAWQGGVGYYAEWQIQNASVGDAMAGGTAAGWPWGVSPSLTTVWGTRFEGYIAPTANELVAMGKPRFIEYMRAGEFDGVPRPEFGDIQIESLWWWANACSYPVVVAGTMPVFTAPLDKVLPVVSAIRVSRSGNSITIKWTTDKPSYGFVNLGQSSGVYYRAKKETVTVYGLEHSVTFDFCLSGRAVHFVIGAQSSSGYLFTTIDQLFIG